MPPYSTIVLKVPAEAEAGKAVPTQIDIKNLVAGPIWFKAKGWLGAMNLFMEKQAEIAAGATRSFSGSFTMPNSAAEVTASSHYWEPMLDSWPLDSFAKKTVALKVGAVVLLAKAERVVSVEITPPPVPQLYLLDSASADVDILQALYLLAKAERVVAPAVMEVVLLAKAERVVVTDITGVVLLASTSQVVIPGVEVGVVLLASTSQVVLPEGIVVPEEEEEVNWWMWGTFAVLGVILVAGIMRGRG